MTQTNIVLVDNVQHNVAGQMIQLRHLGRTESWQYSPMGELTQIQTASRTLGYAYHPNGRLLSKRMADRKFQGCQRKNKDSAGPNK